MQRVKAILNINLLWRIFLACVFLVHIWISEGLKIENVKKFQEGKNIFVNKGRTHPDPPPLADIIPILIDLFLFLVPIRIKGVEPWRAGVVLADILASRKKSKDKFERGFIPHLFFFHNICICVLTKWLALTFFLLALRAHTKIALLVLPPAPPPPSQTSIFFDNKKKSPSQFET